MRYLFCLAIISLTVFRLDAQLDRATLTGTTSDPSGAVVPAVKVVIQNTATGDRYETLANESGQYFRPNLPVGPYRVVFSAPNFKELVREGIELGLAEVLRLDVSLQVGSVGESVEVTAELPRLQSDVPEVGTTLTNKNLVDLPLSFSGTRNAGTFAFKIMPGVMGSEPASHINGSTEYSKETLVDGASITSSSAGAFGPVAVSVEAIQEFRVQTSGMSAEYGRTQGGVFNFLMKSGANQIHGSAYFDTHNEALNSNTFANNARGLPRAPDRKRNYAFGFGGPVCLPKVYNGKNRTFFYSTYERYHELSTGMSAPNRTVPIPAFYDGDLSRLLGAATGQTDALGRSVFRGAVYDPSTFRQLPNGRWVGDMFTGNRIPVSRFSKVSQRLNEIARQLYPATGADSTGQIPLVNNESFPSSVQPQWDQHLFSIKGDQLINDRQRIAGSFTYSYRPRLNLDQGGLWSAGDPTGGPLSKAREELVLGRLARLTHDYTISPRLLNHFVVFYNRSTNSVHTAHANINGARELGIKNLDTVGFPVIGWGGGPAVTLQNPGDPVSSYIANTGWGVLESVSFTKGRHFLKAGLDLRRNSLSRRETAGGTFNFNARATAIPGESFSGNLTGYAFASYLLGIVDNGALNDPMALGNRRRYYALFLQDDFKVSRRLTLNFGVRWEYQPPFFEVANRISSWNAGKIDPLSGLPGAYDFAGNCRACTGKRSFGRRSLRDWGPRVGFAWQAFQNWTVRGAYGIFYEGDIANASVASPLSKATSVAWGGTYQLSADAVQPWAGIFNWDSGFPSDRFVPAKFDLSWGNTSRPGMIDPEYGRTPYIQQWNFNIQRALPGRMVLDAGYVGNKSTGLRNGQLRAVNQIQPALLAQYGRNLNNAVRSAADAARNGIRYPYPGFVGTVGSALRDYPQVQGNSTINNYAAPLGFSTYHALQLTVNRNYRSLSAYASYTWSKTLNNITSSQPGQNSAPLDYYNLKLEKTVADYDVPHALKIYASYDLPVGKAKVLWGGAGRLTNALVGGWSISTIANFYSGTPLGFGGSTPLSSGWNGGANRANVAAGNLKAFGFDKGKFELSTLASPNNKYLDTSLFSDPAPLTLGSGAPSYAQVRSFGTNNLDLGLQKMHRIREKYRFQLRAEALNAFNRHSLGGITTSVTSPLFGQVTTAGGSRLLQVGARLDF